MNVKNSISKQNNIKHEPTIKKIKQIIEYNKFLFKITKLAKKRFQINIKLKNIYPIRDLNSYYCCERTKFYLLN